MLPIKACLAMVWKPLEKVLASGYDVNARMQVVNKNIKR